MRRLGLFDFVPAIMVAGPASADPGQLSEPVASLTPIYVLLLALIVLTGVLLLYVWGLRDRTGNAIAASNLDTAARTTLLTSYNDLPLGVPRGSVRAVLALIIVFGSIAFLAVSMVASDRYKFPESLTGILGAILGFYFGKGGSSDDGQAVTAVVAANADTRQAIATANDAQTQAKDAEAKAGAASQALADVQTRHDELAKDHLQRISDDLHRAVTVGNAMADMLPGSFGEAVADATSALSGTLTAVDDLRTGDLAGAVDRASELLDKAAPDMPVVTVLAKAAAAMGPVLGTAFPPVALLTTLIGIGSKLSAAAYARWVARVMDQPYTQEQFSPAVFDSNAAESLLLQAPAMLKAIGPLLQAGGRDVALDVVRLALAPDGGVALLAKYPAAFANFDQSSIDGAIRDVQKASLDYVLAKDLPPDAGAALGGPPALLQAIDKVRANPEASAGLDAVMTTMAALKRSGENPETAFRDAARLIPGAPVAA
jgi:hypothetical protein